MISIRQSLPRRRALAISVVLAVLTLGAGSAAAQAPASPPVPPAADASPPPPGLIGTIGEWVQQGVANVGAGFGTMIGIIGNHTGETARSVADGASTVARSAADVARDTAATVAKLPTAAGVISGRERCGLAPNGAPDCRAAAETLCRARGYGAGSSVDFETAEKCQVPVRVSNGAAPQRVCTMEHFVTRALCQ